MLSGSLFRQWAGRLLCLAGFSLVATVQANTLLVMGDSLSAGYGMPPEATWVTLMEQQLTEGDSDYTVINASISGETSRGGLERMPALLSDYKPNVVILELGANDGLRGFQIDHITRNLSEMIELSQQSGATVILLGIRLPPNFGSRYTEPFFEQYATLADQHDVLYLPFMLEGVAQYRDLMQDDGLHPTSDAQPIILDNVWPLVQEALSQTSS
ncbi:arylesterase [Saccharospirillum impatiens]|uniref:arylesterase n=1 Tax=Saccharospirillum impatiens TaxID=169438 RepID=UPI0004088282|nr:arylesterase [Saccharospirillum impatiens]